MTQLHVLSLGLRPNRPGVNSSNSFTSPYTPAMTNQTEPQGIFFAAELPLSWKALNPLQSVQTMQWQHEAVTLLRALAMIETPVIEADRDISSSGKSMERLEAKLDLALNLIMQLARQQTELPAPHPVILRANTVEWTGAAALEPAQLILVSLHLSPILPQALLLPATVSSVEHLETATRVRGRIERILDWATVHNYRSGVNPARWKGHLEHLLGDPIKFRATKHKPALHYSKIGDFLQDLRTQVHPSARMLEFTILTAVRSSEARGATWGEIDIEEAIWTIPASRMNMTKEHRVPLAPRVVEILRDARSGAQAITAATLVFPGPIEGKPFNDSAMLALQRRMGYKNITVHGYRSSFRDWAAECTNYPSDVCEMALAHSIPNAMVAFNRRGYLFAKRTALMNDWSEYCNTPSGETVV
ncbi:MAG: PilZ domain-containing protein [Sulfurimicrobium sp.]|nr:PilZ domain-containing protein [Sulfurimicrobium sp.]